jgi:hypothetical protein
MNVQRRDFLLLVTLATAAATPALGQAAPAVSNSGAQSAASVPDFSGIWGRQSIGFEPPLSGPGPVLNKSRLPTGEGNIDQLVGDYTNPILKPQAAEQVKKQGEISLAGVAFPDPNNQCRPQGVPYTFSHWELQMLQQPDKITILYWFDHQVRHVRMNQSHPARVTPSWSGDSVGHYEGDTLVIDTIGVKVGPFAMVDIFGTPHTEALHVVERYQMLDYEAAKEGFERDAKEHNVAPGMPPPNASGKYLQLQFTVEDKNVFTTPWTATMTFRSGGNGPLDWTELTCAENIQWYPGKDADVPRAFKPDF